MRADGQTFAHEHADVRDANGSPVFAMPGQQFGPDLQVHADFETPGLYQIWGQFRLATGEVITVPFTIDAACTPPLCTTTPASPTSTQQQEASYDHEH